MKNSGIKHIAVIMDGNRRWAKQKGLTSLEGHKKGLETLVNTVKAVSKYGIKYLTVYALSTENYSNRPAEEIKGLLSLLSEAAKKYLPTLLKEGIRVKFIGNLDALPLASRLVLDQVSKQLSNGKNGTLLIALNYGGRQEILQAATAAGKKDTLTEESFESYLYTSGIPYPDLIIRTGGQKRMSNFLLWQAAYSELFFTDTLWPDFSEKDLKEALASFEERKRNFGG